MASHSRESDIKSGQSDKLETSDTSESEEGSSSGTDDDDKGQVDDDHDNRRGGPHTGLFSFSYRLLLFSTFFSIVRYSEIYDWRYVF